MLELYYKPILLCLRWQFALHSIKQKPTLRVCFLIRRNAVDLQIFSLELRLSWARHKPNNLILYHLALVLLIRWSLRLGLQSLHEPFFRDVLQPILEVDGRVFLVVDAISFEGLVIGLCLEYLLLEEVRREIVLGFYVFLAEGDIDVLHLVRYLVAIDHVRGFFL